MAVPVAFVKCVVWDLDDTVWAGTLLEDRDVRVNPAAVAAIKTLDRRGILHSVASHNDADLAEAKLEELGLAEYFLVPQINWRPKSVSVRAVADALGIGVGALAYVDDQRYHLGEVGDALPEVRCYPADRIPTLVDLPELSPVLVSADARRRRSLYHSQHRRDADERAFAGPKEEFLAGLRMVATVSPAGAEGLVRAEELTARTHQLNTTGVTYDRDELAALAASADHHVLTTELSDRYGSYGTVGLTLLDIGPDQWELRLFLFSCRVLTRGLGACLLAGLTGAARDAGVRLRARFVPSGRNRAMLVALRFSGFAIVAEDGDGMVLEHRGEVPAPSPHIELRGLSSALDRRRPPEPVR
jgi:FkbH-like protein